MANCMEKTKLNYFFDRNDFDKNDIIILDSIMNLKLFQVLIDFFITNIIVRKYTNFLLALKVVYITFAIFMMMHI